MMYRDPEITDYQEPELGIFHPIPVSREKHGYNVHHKRNSIQLPPKTIQRIENLYKDKIPREQLALFYLINHSILRQDVRDELRDIVLLDDHEFFDSELLQDDTEPNIRKFVKYILNGKRLFIDGNGCEPKKSERDEHHLIPRSRRRDGFETRKGINSFKNIGKKFHANWHTRYNNKTPQEILEDDMQCIKSILSNDIRDRISEIITLPKEGFYIPKVLQ